MSDAANEPGKSYDVDDRRRAAALKACEGLPTEALERGLVNELYILAMFTAVMDGMAERRDGCVLIPEHMWARDVRARINILNDCVVPGSTAKKAN